MKRGEGGSRTEAKSSDIYFSYLITVTVSGGLYRPTFNKESKMTLLDLKSLRRMSKKHPLEKTLRKKMKERILLTDSWRDGTENIKFTLPISSQLCSVIA